MGLGAGIAGAISGRKNRKEGSKLYGEGLVERDAALASRQDLGESAALNTAYGLAQSLLTGETETQVELKKNAARKQSSNLGAVKRYATDGASALAAALGVNDSYNQDLGEAAVVGAQERFKNKQDFYDQSAAKTQYGLLQYDLNVQQPYLQRLQFANDKIGAGLNLKLSGRNQEAAGYGAAADGAMELALSAATGGLSSAGKAAGAAAG